MRDVRDCSQLAEPDKFGPFSIGIELDVRFVSSVDSSPPFWFAERFLEQFWLAANIAFPGSLDLGHARYETEDEDSDYEPPRLDAESLLSGVVEARRRGWPVLDCLPFERVWNWLHDDKIYDIDLADSPSRIALFALLQSAKRLPFDPANVLSIAQGLEALLEPARNGIARSLTERLESALGLPRNLQAVVQRFYRLRSGIVHGSYAHLRPTIAHSRQNPVRDRVLDEMCEVPLLPTAALIALLQELVRRNDRAFVLGGRALTAGDTVPPGGAGSTGRPRAGDRAALTPRP